MTKDKGAVVQGGHYPPDGTNNLNLIWNGSPGWYANGNGNTQNFNNGHVYDLSLELKKILNYKKLNIIYHDADNKWWITFLGLP